MPSGPFHAETPTSPPADGEVICFCFGHTAGAIRADVRRHGRSTILEAIAAAKKDGRCRCAATHPLGR